MSQKKLLIAAGGTGGHVFPAQALAHDACIRGWEVHFITEKRGAQWKGFDENVKLHKIMTGNFGDGSLVKKLLNIVFLGVGVLQSILLMWWIRPQAIVGFGGYPSFPALIGSLFHPTKRIVHEQNAVLGRVNRWLHPILDKVAISIPLTKKYTKTVQTGMPVRPAVRVGRVDPYPPLSGTINIVVLGGSQGAKVFSEVLPTAFETIRNTTQVDLNIIQQCREELLSETKEAYQKTGIKVELTPFIEVVSEVLVKAHLVISRAGASSIAEVTTVGRPSILIPYPWAMDDHQTANAEAIKKKGAAWVMDEERFKQGHFTILLRDLLLDPDKLSQAAQKAKKIGPIDATDKLIKLIEGKL